MSATRVPERRFNRRDLLTQLQYGDVNRIIRKDNHDNSRFFDDLPDEFTCIFADIDNDLAILYGILTSIPSYTIKFTEDHGPVFTREEDVEAIAKWACQALTHAANVLLTSDNLVLPKIRDITGKSIDKLDAKGILLSYLACNTVKLNTHLTEMTNTDKTGDLRRHPYMNIFMAFNNLINSSQPAWIHRVLEKRHPTRELGTSDIVRIGIGVGFFLVVGMASAVAAVATSRDNSPDRSPSPGRSP